MILDEYVYEVLLCANRLVRSELFHHLRRLCCAGISHKIIKMVALEHDFRSGLDHPALPTMRLAVLWLPHPAYTTHLQRGLATHIYRSFYQAQHRR